MSNTRDTGATDGASLSQLISHSNVQLTRKWTIPLTPTSGEQVLQLWDGTAYAHLKKKISMPIRQCTQICVRIYTFGGQNITVFPEFVEVVNFGPSTAVTAEKTKLSAGRDAFVTTTPRPLEYDLANAYTIYIRCKAQRLQAGAVAEVSLVELWSKAPPMIGEEARGILKTMESVRLIKNTADQTSAFHLNPVTYQRVIKALERVVREKTSE